jgi:hydrogenase nickel incorporation protein HypA/HybF
MHELAVCQGLMNQVEQIAQRENAERVTRILLRVGPLSGVEPQLLIDAFSIASAGPITRTCCWTLPSKRSSQLPLSSASKRSS